MKKMKNVKTKVMALLMAVVLLMGMSVPAYAADATINTTKTGSLTLYKYDYNAAANGGVTGSYTSTGEQNTTVESAYAGYAIEGVTFTALNVADIQMYTYTITDSVTATATGTGVEVVYGLDTALATALGLETQDAVTISSKYYWTSTQISEALVAKLQSDSTATANSLKSYITTSENGAVSQTTNTAGMASWSNLALGLYLVVETAVPDQVNTTTDPFFVSIPMTTADGDEWLYNVTAYPKNQTDFPDITKKVRETVYTNDGTYSDTVSTSIEDSLDYRIVSNLPVITSEATYLTKYTFVDTLSKGQTFKEDVVVSFYETISDRTAASLGTADVTLTANDDYTVTTGKDSNSNTVITITLTAAGLEKVNKGAAAAATRNGAYNYIVISYTAILNEDAVLGDAGNENDVTLTYSRTNENYTEKLEDKTEVYTFGLNITKKLSGGSATDVSGVEFTLTNSAGKYIAATKNSDGNYTVKGLADTSDSGNDTVFSPASDGSLYIAGIEAGTYTLTEIKSVSGYTLLKDPITIEITSKAETITASYAYYPSCTDGNTVTTTTGTTGVVISASPENSSATVNGETATMSAYGTVSASANAAVVLEITNTKGFTLPTTGGAGIWLVTILGVVIGGLGIYILVSKRREEN